jgi:hypothetical protein
MTCPRPLYPHEFLAEMLVPGYENVHVLGCFARYATIYSQQVRAINLVDALCRTGRLAKGTRVDVVGGSTAGLTAALAAAARGASVRVFEKEAHLFPIQRNPGKRFLHPHIYDWPLGELFEGSAGLPILNWEANHADQVIAALEEGWTQACARIKPRPVVEMGTELVDLRMNGSKPVLHFPAAQVETDVAILAIGFGAEVERPDLQRYWQSDPIDSTSIGSRVLVSGAGDGALTDVMRLCIQDFKHDRIVQMLLRDERLVSALKDLLSGPEGKRTEDIFREVTEDTRFSLGPLEVTFRSIEVILNAPDDYLESVRTAILNRFIAYLLERERKFRRVPGVLLYPIPRPDEHSNRQRKGDRRPPAGTAWTGA